MSAPRRPSNGTSGANQRDPAAATEKCHRPAISGSKRDRGERPLEVLGAFPEARAIQALCQLSYSPEMSDLQG
jgi:hypothetical protein